MIHSSFVSIFVKRRENSKNEKSTNYIKTSSVCVCVHALHSQGGQIYEFFNGNKHTHIRKTYV